MRFLSPILGALALAAVLPVCASAADATLGPPVAKMPANAVQMDQLLAAGKYSELSDILQKTGTPEEVLLNANWERSKLTSGAGFFMAVAYSADSWRLAHLDPKNTATVQENAVVFLLYGLTVTLVDGKRCVDPAAPADRTRFVLSSDREIWKFIGAADAALRAKWIESTIDLERRLAVLRQNDSFLCGTTTDSKFLEGKDFAPLMEAARADLPRLLPKAIAAAAK